jgi:hypothetical protein
MGVAWKIKASQSTRPTSVLAQGVAKGNGALLHTRPPPQQRDKIASAAAWRMENSEPVEISIIHNCCMSDRVFCAGYIHTESAMRIFSS